MTSKHDDHAITVGPHLPGVGSRAEAETSTVPGGPPQMDCKKSYSVMTSMSWPVARSLKAF